MGVSPLETAVVNGGFSFMNNTLIGRYARITPDDPLNNWRLVIVAELSNGWVEVSRIKIPSNQLCVDSKAFPGWRVQVLDPAPDKIREKAEIRSMELNLLNA